MVRRRPQRVALLTGGGDCPGLNVVIRAASRTAFNLGWEVWGVEDGFDGLLARRVRRLTRRDVRGILQLGHLQRGGSPTTFDRLLGTRFGAAAMRFVAQGRFGTMVALDPPRVLAVPLRKAVGQGKTRRVPLDSDVIRSARDVGIGFGD